MKGLDLHDREHFRVHADGTRIPVHQQADLRPGLEEMVGAADAADRHAGRLVRRRGRWCRSIPTICRGSTIRSISASRARSRWSASTASSAPAALHGPAAVGTSIASSRLMAEVAQRRSGSFTSAERGRRRRAHLLLSQGRRLSAGGLGRAGVRGGVRGLSQRPRQGPDRRGAAHAADHRGRRR